MIAKELKQKKHTFGFPCQERLFSFLFKTSELVLQNQVQKSAFGPTSVRTGTGVCTPACKNIQKHPAKTEKDVFRKDSRRSPSFKTRFHLARRNNASMYKPVKKSGVEDGYNTSIYTGPQYIPPRQPR